LAKAYASRFIILGPLVLAVSLFGCARMGSVPQEPLAEDIPLTPGVTVTANWTKPPKAHPDAKSAKTPQDAAQTSLAAQQSEELDRRIRELRRQRGELDKLKEEIKEILESAPRAQ